MAREDTENGSTSDGGSELFLDEMSNPNKWRIYLDPENNPTNEKLDGYFKDICQNKALTNRVQEIAGDNQLEFLHLHRQWSVQVLNPLNHIVLKQVTTVLTTMDDKKKGLCELSTKNNCLQTALRSGDRLVIGELLYQEFLCHKTDPEADPSDQINGTKCIKKQLTIDDDINYAMETFDSFYPQSTLKKVASFGFGLVLPCLFGIFLTCFDIWQDMNLTLQLDELSRNETLSKDDTFKYGKAYGLSAASQIVPFVFSLPLWIWMFIEVVNKLQTSTGYAQVPRDEGQETSPKERLTRILQFIEFIISSCPPVAFIIVFRVQYALRKISCLKSVVWACNSFSATLIVGIGLIRIIKSWMATFGDETYKSEYQQNLQIIERQFGFGTVIESCLEATMQLGIQIWLLSREEQIAPKLEHGLFLGSMQIILSIFTSEEEINAFQVQLILKLLLTCTSLIYSVSGSYRFMKNQNIPLHHLAFLFLSNICQLWARVNVMWAWCYHTEDRSMAWQSTGMGLFLLIHGIIAFVLKIQFWKSSKGLNLKPHNGIAFALDLTGSTILLVRLPKVDKDNKTISQESWTLQSFYFIFSFAFNIIFTVITRCYSSNPEKLNETFGEIFACFVISCIGQFVYYTLYGHPWRAIIRNRFKEKLKKFKKFLIKKCKKE